MILIESIIQTVGQRDGRTYIYYFIESWEQNERNATRSIPETFIRERKFIRNLMLLLGFFKSLFIGIVHIIFNLFNKNKL